MATTVATTNTVVSFLEKAGGDYVEAYQQIVSDIEAKALALRPRSNTETRKAAYLRLISDGKDKSQLRSLQNTLRDFLKLADEASGILDSTGDLTEEQAQALMVLTLEAKRIKEVAASQIDATRARVFNAMDEEMAAQGAEFPEVEPAYIPVPELGLKFTREGGIPGQPELNEDMLAAIVGPEVWEQVTTVEVIPAQEVRTFNEGLFLQAARSNPELIESLRKSLVPGKFGKVSFHQRAYEVPTNTEEEDER